MDIIYFINYIKYSFRHHKYLIFIPAIVICSIYIFMSRDLFFEKKNILTSELKFNNQLFTFMDLNNIFVRMKNYQSLDFEVSEANYLSEFILKEFKQKHIIVTELRKLMINTDIIDEDFFKNEKKYVKKLEKKYLITKDEFDNDFIINDLSSNIKINTTTEGSIVIEFDSSLSEERSIIFFENIKIALSKLLINHIEKHSDYVMKRIDSERKQFISLKQLLLLKDINETNDQIKLVESLDGNILNKNTSEGIDWNLDYLKAKIQILQNSNIEDMFNDYEAEKYAIFDNDYKEINNMKKKLESYKTEKKAMLNLVFYEKHYMKLSNNNYLFLYLFALIFISLIPSLSICFYKFKIHKLAK